MAGLPVDLNLPLNREEIEGGLPDLNEDLFWDEFSQGLFWPRRT